MIIIAKRNSKFYSKNEKKVMEEYGLKATPQSGAGWLIKEDGQNENIIAQLKSTDAQSYRISLDDIDKLEYHALVENKIPLFIIEFLERDERYFVLRPKDLVALGNLLKLPKNVSDVNLVTQINVPELMKDDTNEEQRKVIKSSPKSRMKINKYREEKYRNKNGKHK